MGLQVLPYIPAALHHLLHSWGWKLQKAADGEDKEHTFWDSLFPASILCSNQRNEIAKPLPHFWKVWKTARFAVSNWRGTFQLHGRRGSFVTDFCLFVYLFCKTNFITRWTWNGSELDVEMREFAGAPFPEFSYRHMSPPQLLKF